MHGSLRIPLTSEAYITASPRHRESGSRVRFLRILLRAVTGTTARSDLRFSMTGGSVKIGLFRNLQLCHLCDANESYHEHEKMLRIGVASLFAIAIIIPTKAADLSASKEVEFPTIAVVIGVLGFGLTARILQRAGMLKGEPVAEMR
jgi:hypothetical protein